VNNIAELGFVTCMETIYIRDQCHVIMGTEKGKVYSINYVLESRVFSINEISSFKNQHEIGKILIQPEDQRIYIITSESEIFIFKLLQI
jgi:hypothetical protein